MTVDEEGSLYHTCTLTTYQLPASSRWAGSWNRVGSGEVDCASGSTSSTEPNCHTDQANVRPAVEGVPPHVTVCALAVTSSTSAADALTEVPPKMETIGVSAEVSTPTKALPTPHSCKKLHKVALKRYSVPATSRLEEMLDGGDITKDELRNSSSAVVSTAGVVVTEKFRLSHALPPAPLDAARSRVRSPQLPREAGCDMTTTG